MSKRLHEREGERTPRAPMPGASEKIGRVEGIDVARGLASIIMIQGHAYDGWVADEHRTSVGYLFTRLLGTLPLPAFLVLAGAAVALRVEAATRKGEAASAVRAAIVKRGLGIVVIGYLVNAASALMDGWSGIETFTRSDVLHVIGLGLVAIGVTCVRADAALGVDTRHFARAALALTILPVLLAPIVTPIGAMLTGPLRHLLAPIVYVPNVSQMPFFPLAGWLGLGVLTTRALGRANLGKNHIAGAPDRVLLLFAAGSLAVTLLGNYATDALLELVPGPLSTAHVAVIPNAIELGGRGVLVLAVGALLAPRIHGRAKAALLRLGRGSLVAYVFHIPFVYGALGEPVRGRLDMVEASGLVLVLIAVSYLAVVLRDTLRDRRARGVAAQAEARG